jgi:mannose-6-phosphate isomerase-like protein (cupin superfamily)
VKFNEEEEMKLINPLEFKAERAWGALDIAEIDGATVRLHWTDQPYKWHVNDGAEVFVVLDGEVDMHYREGGAEQSARMKAGDIFYADAGDAHVAHPVGEARVLVIERAGSV